MKKFVFFEKGKVFLVDLISTLAIGVMYIISGKTFYLSKLYPFSIVIALQILLWAKLPKMTSGMDSSDPPFLGDEGGGGWRGKGGGGLGEAEPFFRTFVQEELASNWDFGWELAL